MISEKIVAALNKQIKMEAHASFLYLSMASWCDQQSMEGCAQFMFRQSAEEHQHMMKLFHYLLEMDQAAMAPDVPNVPNEFDDIESLFESVYMHEKKVTRAINDLVDLANKENDHSTHIFLQWYVEEQREEEALMRSILDKIKLIGNGPQRLYYVDKEVEIINEKTVVSEQGQ